MAKAEGVTNVVSSALLPYSERCSSVSHLKQIHACLIRHLPLLSRTAAACAVLAKLLRFAAVSPRGDLCYATRILSYHLPHLASAAANLTFFYNTLLRGYSNSPAPHRALSLFVSMRCHSIPPDPFSFTFLLKACSRCLLSSSASDVHACALKFGCLASHPTHVDVHNALINHYASRANPSAARQVFDQMPRPDVVSWSGMMTAHLKASDPDAARAVFDAMPERDVVAWTAMISGYTHARRPKDALDLFLLMPVPPDEITLVGVISACAALGDLATGERVHRYIEERGFGWMISLRNALIDMYSKCGCFLKARHVFDGTGTKSLVTWNSIISAYAAHGNAEGATALFHRMAKSGIVNPDGVTLLAVLTACTHEGRVEEGRRLFEGLRNGDYVGAEAGVEHYGCMVDLLGRAGQLEEAYQLIEEMPIPSNDTVWGALLGACRIHGNVEMGERAVAKLMELKPKEGGYYVLLSSIYTAAGRLEEAAEIRRSMKERKARKNPGRSSWDVAAAVSCSGEVVHDFIL
ncbi:Pentatricopeptide repeat-containing protein [Canna indica]|uniref:Pentatricopeptide repeat-containing protein n=1 Tax=Canna indica TaxID=4628 RepID=A0AAQ3KNV1_9LILI|nr:Pentatricopeptide repeat-containing protein [Canna indica]